MAFDKNYMLLDDAITLAEKYYDKKTLEHARRVFYYVVMNEAIPDRLRNDCQCLAFMHDLIEDTEYDPAPGDLPPNFHKALLKLTKPKGMGYDEYCDIIKPSAKPDWGKCAWFVKLADMKDHLSQVDTLTPRLKEKYLSGLRYLL